MNQTSFYEPTEWIKNVPYIPVVGFLAEVKARILNSDNQSGQIKI